MRKTKFWKWITNIKVISVLIVVAATGLGALGVHQAQEYERSTLAIYAEQQDAYVQLVLDQINLKDNRNDEQIIKEILETMDASSNHYWTFSKDQ